MADTFHKNSIPTAELCAWDDKYVQKFGSNTMGNDKYEKMKQRFIDNYIQQFIRKNEDFILTHIKAVYNDLMLLFPSASSSTLKKDGIFKFYAQENTDLGSKVYLVEPDLTNGITLFASVSENIPGFARRDQSKDINVPIGNDKMQLLDNLKIAESQISEFFLDAK
jgi:hypothetical protein